MKRLPGPVIALLVAALLAVAAVVVVLVGGDDVAPTALTVDGDTTTSATLDAQLEGFASGTYFVDGYEQAGRSFTVSEGSIAATGTAQWLSFVTQTALAESILARRDATLGQRQVERAAAALEQQGVTAGMSDDSAEVLARFSASGRAVSRELGSDDEYRAAMRREARRAEITVDAKYGRWSPRRLAFCVPEGCRLGGASVVPQSQSGG